MRRRTLAAPLPDRATMLRDLEELCSFLDGRYRKCAQQSEMPARLAYLGWMGGGARGQTLKAIRHTVLFYSTGWGWRLRAGWREAFAVKTTPAFAEAFAAPAGGAP